MMRLRLFALHALLATTLLAVPTLASGPAPERPTQRFEINFMEGTIEHHLLGVAMAELCVQKTTEPPPEGDTTLRELCASIAQNQAAEAAQLQSWLRDWYGIEFEPDIKPGPLKQLERAEGEQFDIKVSDMFIEHHLVQLKNSTKCLLKAFHPELLALCQQTIVAQSAEILTFRDILQQHGEDFHGS